MNRIRTARRLSAGAVALLFSAVGIAATTSPAKAAGPNDFDLLAGASAFDIHIQDNSLPVTQTIDASPFGSSAMLSSSGVVKSDAGAPYAPFGYSLPRTATGVGAGLLPPIPSFPGYVAATFPVVPVATQKTGGYEITASTSETAARGEVKLGSQPAGSTNATGFAISETRANADGTVTGLAAAGSGLFSFGGVLDLGRVSSTLGITVPASGKPVISSGTDLGTVTFASNFTSGARDGTTFVAGQPVPLSLDVLEAVNQYAGPYGLTFTYLPQTFGYADGTTSEGAKPDPGKTVRSVLSGGLQIATNNKVPTQGDVFARYTLGRVSLSATNVALTVSGTGPAAPGAPGPGLGVGAPGVDGTNAAGLATGAAGVELPAPGLVDNGSGAPPATSNDGATSTSGAGSQQPASAVLTQQADAVAYSGPAATSSQSLYLMLAVAAAAAIAGAQLIRFFTARA